MAEDDNTLDRACSYVNWTAALLLIVLIGLGSFVSVHNVVVGGFSTDGYVAIDVNPPSWKIACPVVGTFVGLLASVAFSMQDNAMTRQELFSRRGVVALFLRPLTLRRGAEQIYKRQLPLERSLILLLTVLTALSSAAVVALFDIQATTEAIVNPTASFPLSALNSTFFWSDPSDPVVTAGTIPLFSATAGQLTAFLYRTALIVGMQLQNTYNRNDDTSLTLFIPEQGQIGSNIYPGLSTGGIGLNTSTYIQYTGPPTGVFMPAQYQFSGLQGVVFGTHVNVTC